MSEWDEKASDAAEVDALYANPWTPADSARYGGFTRGARWQREQLLSDQTIERAARALVWETTGGGYARPDGQDRDIARRILAAALEGDE